MVFLILFNTANKALDLIKNNPKKLGSVFLSFLLLSCAGQSNGVTSLETAQVTTPITYTVSEADILNPGRGFYFPTQTKTSEFEPLKEADLLALRNNYSVPSKANYAVRHSIFLRQYILDSFVTTPTLTETFLQQMQNDFDVARKAGGKLLIRFSYSNTPPTGDCGSWICPPYGDASKEVVLAHIAQVAKVINNNLDVLFTWQAGFIGTWGEMMFTDHFGDFDTQGTIYDENWNDRIDMVKAILDAVPAEVTVQVRKPQLIQKFVHGAGAPITVDALTEKQAFDGGYASRLGLYNDCFLATADDWGTFADYGSSANAPHNDDDVVKTLKQHQAQNSQYTLVGGETCDDGYSPQNDCSGDVVGIMDRFNYTYLNSAYNNLVNSDWEDEGCMTDIKRRLGYRLSMFEGRYSNSASPGKSLAFYLSIKNTGFTSPMFPMQLRVVLTHKTTGEETIISLDKQKYDIRQWRPESVIVIDESIMLPRSMAAGDYHMSLHIADTSNGGVITNRPEYSIQFANTNTWDNNKGYNSLLHTITVSK